MQNMKTLLHMLEERGLCFSSLCPSMCGKDARLGLTPGRSSSSRPGPGRDHDLTSSDFEWAKPEGPDKSIDKASNIHVRLNPQDSLRNLATFEAVATNIPSQTNFSVGHRYHFSQTREWMHVQYTGSPWDQQKWIKSISNESHFESLSGSTANVRKCWAFSISLTESNERAQGESHPWQVKLSQFGSCFTKLTKLVDDHTWQEQHNMLNHAETIANMNYAQNRRAEVACTASKAKS